MKRLSIRAFAIAVIFAFLRTAQPAIAQPAGEASVTGTFVSQSNQQPVANAKILLVGANGQGIYTATTDTKGRFTFAAVPVGTYRLETQSSSFYAPEKTIAVTTSGATVALEGIRTIAAVVVAAPRRLAPGNSELYHAPTTQVVLDQNVIKAQAPLAGSEQLLAAAPGVTQASYGSTGAAKSMISLRGFKQGWANQAGVVDDGLFGVALNGVYLNNPQTGIWEPDEVPDLSIISGARVSYGPGDPATRTFDSIGGTVDFYTILPSKTSTARASFTAGSYGGQGYHVDFSRALSSRWSVLVSQGRTFTQGFRDIYGSGSAAPGTTYGTYAELQNLFPRGSMLFFIYSADGTEYRPNLVPVKPLVGPGGQVVTVNGFDLNGNPIAGPAYSQATTDFYSALPASVWQKTDTNATRLAAMDLNYTFGGGSYVTNQLWWRQGNRLHVKDFNFDQDNNTSRFEYNNPYSDAFGDTATYHLIQGPHDIAIGTNLLYSHYETRNAFYNPSLIESAPNLPTNYMQPSNFRNNDFWMSDLALFVQDTIRIDDRTSFLAGIRSVALNTSFVNNGYAFFSTCLDPTSPCFDNNHTSEPNSTTSFHEFEPGFSLRYAFAPDFASYVSYGRGIRNPQTSPGGPYQRVSVQGLLPEATDDAEGGIKFYQRLPGNNLDGSPREDFATLGLFDSTLQNQNIPITTGQGLVVSNASGSSRYSGFTFAFNASVDRSLQAFGSLGVTHAVFSHYTLPSGVTYTGLPVTQTPIDTANLGLVGSASLGKNLGTVRLWDQFVGSSTMWDNSGLVNGYQGPSLTNQQIPSYNLINGSISYRFGSSHEPLAISVAATNLFNKQYNVFEYITSGAYFGGGVGQSVPYGQGEVVADPGPPREVQVTLSIGE